MAASRKIEEGKKLLTAGEKCLKTSLFKWNPDHDGAASEFTKAATCFKNAKSYAEAKGAFIRASDCQQELKSFFHAAKSLEQAGMMCKEAGNMEESAGLIERAAYLYRENGTVDTAAITLERAAKMVEQKNPARAVKLFETASDVAEIEDRHQQAAQLLGKAARLLININKHDEALTYLDRELRLWAAAGNAGSAAKTVSGIVLLHVHRGDSVAASRALAAGLSMPGVSGSDEAGPLQQLVTAFDEGDMQETARLAWQPCFKYLDNAFAKLARDISGRANQSSEAPATVAGTADDDDDDDDEDLR